MDDRERVNELTNELFNSTDERAVEVNDRVACGGCSTVYASLHGLHVVAQPFSEHPWRVFVDSAECARKRALPEVARAIEDADAMGSGVVTVSATGTPLPGWRVAEIREGAHFTEADAPWKSEADESAPVKPRDDLFSKDPDLLLAEVDELLDDVADEGSEAE